IILSFWLWLCRTASLPLCDFALTAFVGFKRSEHTCSTFLLPFTLHRWTESVTCTGSSLFAVGYAYSERHREYSALLPCWLRQTDLNPRQECQKSETPATSGPAQRQPLLAFSRRHSHPRPEPRSGAQPLQSGAL